MAGETKAFEHAKGAVSLPTGNLRGSRPSVRHHLSGLLGDCRPRCFDLRLQRIQVETRAFLHRRKLDSSHRELFDLLLNKHEAPEFVLEPVEILLRSFLGTAVRPPRPLQPRPSECGSLLPICWLSRRMYRMARRVANFYCPHKYTRNRCAP